ncbi:hypothetical protein Glove_74g219 [Diversispora epigaea]|uniref:Uncharacterized protein n=1 Tax=Diversispora epigaea TaxID=1348612 RepID=A0A397JDH8_9GLOM|nr:hypothetical protein Glove_74g219 [Diversispora epigaea]
MKKDDNKKIKRKDDAENIWVLTMFFSWYKESEYFIDNRSFKTIKLTEGAMRKEAKRLYKESDDDVLPSSEEDSNDDYY